MRITSDPPDTPAATFTSETLTRVPPSAQAVIKGPQVPTVSEESPVLSRLRSTMMAGPGFPPSRAGATAGPASIHKNSCPGLQPRLP